MDSSVTPPNWEEITEIVDWIMQSDPDPYFCPAVPMITSLGDNHIAPPHPMPVSKAANIPHDILYDIFTMGTHQPDDPDFPILVSQVCRDWRYLALATPTLWSSIPMYCHKHTTDHSRWLFARLMRSTGVPITLNIFMTRPFTWCEMETVLMPHLHRIKGMNVMLGEQTRRLLLMEVWRMLALDFPRLQRFSFQVGQGSKFEVVTQQPCPFRLPSLHPQSGRIDWTNWMWIPRNLKSFCLSFLPPEHTPTLADLHTMLAGSSSTLQNLEIRSPVVPTEHFPPTNERASTDKRPPRPITLPSLKSLTIGYISATPCDDSLASLLYTPNVRDVTIRDLRRCPEACTGQGLSLGSYTTNRRVPWQGPPDHLLSLIFLKPPFPFTSTTFENPPPSFSSLTTLDLRGLTCTSHSLAFYLFKHTPHLHDLTLYNSSKVLLEGLAEAHQYHAFSPSSEGFVRSLTVTNVSFDDGLLPFLERRELFGYPKMKKLCVSPDCLLPPPTTCGNETHKQRGKEGEELARRVRSRGAMMTLVACAEVVMGISTPRDFLVVGELERELARDGRVNWEFLDRFVED
ncbi:hypothetical protein JAAARDRAFT_206662 [Jaapia argillacea MUCL 33604]|uniref:Uncharacterized protein n=1 Tax=Jaapia argillacea MUCL 33604 TaxID=933084 RepID=A0A067Q2Z2_9AGAM|nr:hypothetical protein JAAARDRAFT_206662 [Jaapia argillacea MUCL 33604]